MCCPVGVDLTILDADTRRGAVSSSASLPISRYPLTSTRLIEFNPSYSTCYCFFIFVFVCSAVLLVPTCKTVKVKAAAAQLVSLSPGVYVSARRRLVP